MLFGTAGRTERAEILVDFLTLQFHILIFNERKQWVEIDYVTK